MPIRPRRAKRSTRFNHPDWDEWLLHGGGDQIRFFGLCPITNQPVTPEMAREAWKARRDELLPKFNEEHPGKIPYVEREYPTIEKT